MTKKSSNVESSRPSDRPPGRVSGMQNAQGSGSPPREYVELDGGFGKDVFYRPDRYQRSDLGLVHIAVDITIAGQLRSCELFDVSQNGVAFEWKEGPTPELASEVDELLVQFDGYEAYRGRARISSIRHVSEHTIVGVSLLDTLMNVEDVLHLRDIKAWVAGDAAEKLRTQDAPWRFTGHHEFKALISELRLFLEDGQEHLNEWEASLPAHISGGDQHSAARDALIEQIRNGFSRDVVLASNYIDTTTRSATRSEREAMREFSRRHLHALLMQAPVMRRSLDKPLGYPGDFEIMNYLYANHFAGATLFAKAVNLAFVSTPAGEAVRSRRDLIKRELSKVFDRAGRGRPVRVLSIAAGPAQEIYEVLQERQELAGPVEIVLFEQDRRALAFAYSRLNRVVNDRWLGVVKVTLLHDSIKRLLRGSTVFPGSGDYDMVYASGLCDYLQRPTWVKLCNTLYTPVAPGGTLYVGNMVPSNPSRWLMEFHLDWPLVYREPSEILELARAAAPDAELRICEESTGVNPFVALTRK